MPSTNVLAVSVYKPGMWKWYAIQKRFFDATTLDYRLIVVSENKPPFSCEFVRCPNPQRIHSHLIGLRKAVQVFRREEGHYQLGLICDSDAFPIRHRWDETLMKLIASSRRRFAAPIRLENGDFFPHVSFLAFLPRYANEVLRAIGLGYSWGSVLGISFARMIPKRIKRDLGSRLLLNHCLPLLRSNRWSPSPILHSIYGDIAYHRGSGSRPFATRGWTGYWGKIAPGLHERGCDKRLPDEAYLNRLLGERRFME